MVWDFGLVFGLAIVALYVAAAAGFIPVGMFFLGKGDRKALGAQTFFVGIFQFLSVAYLLATATTIKDPSLQTLVTLIAINVVALSIIWLSLGITLMNEWDLRPMGVHLAISFIVFLALAAWWALKGSAYLTVGNITYAITVFCTALHIAGKLKNAKAVGIIFLVFGVITVLVPAIWLLFAPLP